MADLFSTGDQVIEFGSNPKTGFDLEGAVDVVSELASDFEDALNELGGEAEGVEKGSNLGIVDLTRATTNVQKSQSTLEMAQAIVKSAVDHIKGQAKKLG